MIKKLFITVIVLVFSFSFNLFSQNLKVKQLDLITNQNFVIKKAKVSPVAVAAQKRGVKPGVFKNVSYKLQDNVVILSQQVKSNLQRQLAQMPVLNSETLKRVNVTQNKVYFDPGSELVFKPVGVGEDSLVLAKPKINEVFKDVNIPLQTVPLTVANTDYTLEGTRVTDEEDDGIYTMRMEFNDTIYHFKKKVKKDNQEFFIEINLRLDGFVGFTDPKIEARYSANNGYKITFLAKEKVSLKTTANIELTYDLSFPIWGYTIPIDDWGSCKIGVFLVLDVDGKANLEIRMEQNLSVMAGIRGKTFLMIPRSVKTDVEIEKGYDLGYSYTGELTAFGGVECTAEMTIKGYDLLKLRTRGGLELKASKTDTTAFSVEIGAKLLVDGKLEIKSYKKELTIYEKYFLLWKKQEPDFGGYILNVKNVDAYHDRVWGSVIEEIDSVPYTGDLTLIVTHPNGTKTKYPGKTDQEGVFAMTGIDLKKGDKVQIRIGNKAPSEPVYATLPFKSITLAYADYYTNTVSGSVASYIDYFPEKSQHVSTGGPAKVAGIDPNIVKNTGVMKMGDKSLFMPRLKVTKEMLDNAITYSGDILIVTEPLYHKANLAMPSVGTGTSKGAQSKQKSRISKVGINVPGVQPDKYDNIKKLDVLATKKVINQPFGMFLVKNVNITPGQKVRARINIDGFVLESDFVVSDGLIFTPIGDKNKQGSFLTQDLKADDSFAVVNAFRSDVSPTGKIKLIKGIDMKHTSPYKQFPNQQVNIPRISEFKNAKHPLIYFNVNTQLKPMPDMPGFSIAHTGPWHVNNIYYNPKNLVSMQRMDGHRFEYIGFTYDGRWTGYKYYQKECKMDKQPGYNKVNPTKNPMMPGKHIAPGKKIGRVMY